MLFRRLFRPHVLIVPLALVVACNNDSSSGKKSDAPKAKETIPDDLVVNEFFPEKGGGKARALVDASIGEGGLAVASAGDGDGGAGATASDDDNAVEERKITVLDPGAEPRAQRRYAFKTPAEMRKLTIAAKTTREAQGQKQEMPQPPVTLTMSFALKGTKGGVYHYEATIKSADVDLPPNADKRAVAQAKQALGALTGITASFDVTARGSIGEAKFEGDKLPRGAAEQIAPLFSNALEFVAAPLPDEAIGIGAKWQETTDSAQTGVRMKVTSTYTLKEWGADGGVIEAEVKRSAPKQPMQDPRMQGASMKVDGNGKFRFEAKTAGIVAKATGENTTVINVEAPGPSGKVESALTETSNEKHTFESLAAAPH
jgi:hypothetical protein